MVHKTDSASRNSHSKTGNDKPPVFERIKTECKTLSTTFLTGINDYSKQFAHIYAARLAELRDILVKRASSKWGDIQILKLAELEDFDKQRCVIIGTLYKHQQWKPSILRELSDDHQLSLPEPRVDYCSEKDQAFLEDEMLRIKLVGDKVDLKNIITGIVCAILGHENEDGSFSVEDWCFPGCVPNAVNPATKAKGKLVLLSGLDLANNAETLSVSLLAEWICGMAGTPTIQEEEASIVRVVVAGNTVKVDTKLHTQRGLEEGKAQDSAISKEIAAATKKADNFLAEIAQCCCITVMPGQHDPTNMMLPQKPLHPCLIPKTSRFESFKGVTNPWIGKISDRIIIGTSGQPVEDMVKASGSGHFSPLDCLENTLVWRHMCPTAPDTLPACPYSKEDPFIMRECPDIYFTSNTDKFETKLWKGDEGQIVRLICVPKFCTSYTAVIIDLETLDTRPISFGSA